MKRIFCVLFGLFCLNAFAADLTISAEDVFIKKVDDGALLLVRKKADINSVLLCETTKDPTGQMANYSFRDSKKNAINGDEQRILDGKLLSAAESNWTIVCSTVSNDEDFGECFTLFMPNLMYFGYDWTRNGTRKLEDGMFVNIRTFEKPYADYSGEFRDNPFQLSITEQNSQSVEKYNQETVSAFQALAKMGGGTWLYSENPTDLADKIDELIQPQVGERDLDVVFAIDATRSMSDDIKELRSTLISTIEPTLEQYDSWRIGLVLYKDYGEEFIDKGLPVKIFNFTSNMTIFEKNFFSFRVSGGHDYEEAVYEGVFAACEFLDWRENATRKVILIGDAEPHSTPRGTGLYGKEIAERVISEKRVQLNSIILFDPER